MGSSSNNVVRSIVTDPSLAYKSLQPIGVFGVILSEYLFGGNNT